MKVADTLGKFGLSLFLVAGFTGAALAQAAEPAQAATQEPAQPESGELQAVNLVITKKEVSAVQAALLGRGYYTARPSGVLNAETRAALRSWQADNQLPVTGRIDRATLASLEVTYPATGKEADSVRRNGVVPKIGYAVKDGAVATKDTVTGTTRKVVNGVKTGAEYTKDRTVGAATYTKDKTVGAASYTKDKTASALGRGKKVTVGVGESTAGGVKTAGKKTGGVMQRASDTLAGRSDLDIHADVREVLDADPATRKFTTSVSQGKVTVKLPPGYQGEYGDVIANIRQVSGVKAVFVVQP
jgi:peptidoglycan hydrolase-like protein with peptidoglycan-binding domain